MSFTPTDDKLAEFRSSTEHIQKGLNLLHKYYDRQTIADIFDNPDRPLPLPTKDFALLNNPVNELDRTLSIFLHQDSAANDTLNTAKSSSSDSDFIVKDKTKATLSASLLSLRSNQSKTAPNKENEANKFCKPTALTNDPMALFNYEDEIYDITPPGSNCDFPANFNMFYDGNMLITTIQCEPKAVSIKFGHGFKPATVRDADVEEIFKHSKAATTLTLVSDFQKPVIYPTFMEAGIHQMNVAFFATCKKIVIRGLWHYAVLQKLINQSRAFINVLSIRRCTVSGRFNLKNAVSDNQQRLNYIDFDCRITNTKDFSSNITILRNTFPNDQFTTIFLTVIGFPLDQRRFDEQNEHLQMLLKPHGYATVFSDYILDDPAYDILSKRNFVYAGEKEGEAALPPFTTYHYYVFNRQLKNDKIITLAFRKN